MPREGAVLRVGIVACASISSKTWAAIHASDAAAVTVVGSRDAAKAESWIAGCQKVKPFITAPTAVGSQQEVCSHDQVDAVYIPTPTNTHVPLVVKAAASKKHIVCEKPCVSSKSDLDAVLTACDDAQVVFYDGTMLTHGRRIASIRRVLHATDATYALGTIRQINAVFTFNGGEDFEKTNIRTNPELEPLGSLGDIGWYCIRYAFDAFGSSSVTPLRCRGESRADVNGVPVAFQGDVEFKATASASGSEVVRLSFYVSFRDAHQQQIVFLGSRGCLRVSDFCLPFVGERTSFAVDQHTIEGVDCRIDHTRRTTTVTDPEESSTYQEEQLWRNFAVDAANPTTDVRRAGYDRTWKAHEAVLTCLDSARSTQGFVECRPSPWVPS